MASVTILEPPRTLQDVEYLNAGVSFPGQAMSGSRTALAVFCAAFHGRQDAYWLAQAGLRTTCVDMDGGRLDEMAAVYPDNWEFVQRDAWEFAREAAAAGRTWDVVTIDPFSNRFQEIADDLELWCSLADNVVAFASGVGTRVEAPDGWMVVDVRRRSSHLGGIFWHVLERTGVGIIPSKVSACLVTRGDQPEQMERILASLLDYDEVVVWDNSQRENHMTAGRFMAMGEARNEVCYTQDDDVLVPRETQEKLLRAYNPGVTTAVYGHNDNDGGYGDLPLVCGGGLYHRSAALAAISAYTHEYGEWGRDELAYADFIVGVLVPFRHVHLPFEINLPVAQHPSRLVNQPWAADAKHRMTERARAIRDAT